MKFQDPYEQLGVDLDDLGCIMLDTEPLSVLEHVEGGEGDVYNNPEWKHEGGVVAETKAHVTVLYGLLRSGHEWSRFVDFLLPADLPESVKITEVGYFPGRKDDEDYNVIIAHVDPTGWLGEANAQLAKLPHINKFGEYKAHLTLAYVKSGDEILEKWLSALAPIYNDTSIPVTGLNYGD